MARFCNSVQREGRVNLRDDSVRCCLEIGQTPAKTVVGRPLSDRGKYNRPMNESQSIGGTATGAEELIATFGEARLLRVDGRIILRGGPMSDRMEALEWVRMFLPGQTVAGEER